LLESSTDLGQGLRLLLQDIVFIRDGYSLTSGSAVLMGNRP